jgi:hypothetical protein
MAGDNKSGSSAMFWETACRTAAPKKHEPYLAVVVLKKNRV